MAASVVATSANWNGLFGDPLVSRPAGYGTTWGSGDIVLIYTSWYGFFGSAPTPQWAGFTFIRQGQLATGDQTSGAWFAKTAGALEPSSYDSTGSASSVYTSHCVVVSGATMPTATDGHSSGNSGSSTTRTGLGVTAGAASSILLLGLTGHASGVSSVSGMTEIETMQDTVSAWWEAVGSGATGNRTGTATSSEWAAVMLVVDATGGGGGPTDYPVGISVVHTATPARARAVTRLRNATSVQVAAAIRSAGRSLGALATATPARARSVGAVRAAASVATSTLGARALTTSRAAVSNATPTTTKSFPRAVAAVNTATPTRSRSVALPRAAVATATATRSRALGAVRSAVSTASRVLSRALAVARAATSAGDPSVATEQEGDTTKDLDAVHLAFPAIQRAIARSLGGSSTATPSRIRALARAVAAVSTATASRLRAAALTRGASAAATPTFRRALAAGRSAIVGASSAFARALELRRASASTAAPMEQHGTGTTVPMALGAVVTAFAMLARFIRQAGPAPASTFAGTPPAATFANTKPESTFDPDDEPGSSFGS